MCGNAELSCTESPEVDQAFLAGRVGGAHGGVELTSLDYETPCGFFGSV